MGGAGEGGGIHVTGCQTEIGFFLGVREFSWLLLVLLCFIAFIGECLLNNISVM